jgi:DNA-binding transcriptional ArsR family regulator
MELESIEMLKVLAVETRVKIIDILKTQGPLGAKEIARQLKITPAAVSQHLKILRQAGLLRRERQGYWIPYSLNEEALDRCGHQLLEICTCGCEGSGKWREREMAESSLDALKEFEQELQEELRQVQKRIKEREGE